MSVGRVPINAIKKLIYKKGFCVRDSRLEEKIKTNIHPIPIKKP